jgi:hypothetical protein
VDFEFAEILSQFASLAEKVNQCCPPLDCGRIEDVVVVHEQANEVVDLGVIVFEQEDSEGQDGIVVGAGLVVPGDRDLCLAFPKQCALIGVVGGGGTGGLTHGPVAPGALVLARHLPEASETQRLGRVVRTYLGRNGSRTLNNN